MCLRNLLLILLIVIIPSALATFSLEGYTVEPSSTASSTNYKVKDVGLSWVAGTTNSTNYDAQIGFASIFRNIPPDLNYGSDTYGYVSGIYNIKFYVRDYEFEEPHIKLAYSSTPEAFQNIIAADLNLDNHANIAELSCDSTDWRYLTLCTYSWDTSSVPDNNYYLDLNLWDQMRDFNIYSTPHKLCIDNTPSNITITTPDQNAIVSEPLIEFTLSNTGCAPLLLSTVQVLFNGIASTDFNADACSFGDGNYSCSFYQKGLQERDYNLSVIVTDLAGNVRQLDRNFHFVPTVGVTNISTSGTLESGTITITFTVHNTALNDLYIGIYYSSISAGKLGFENAIDSNIHLDEYESLPNIECDSNVWWPAVQCTYTWDASAVADANYYIDINIWNEDVVENASSSTKQFLLDNTPPQASISDVSTTPVYSDRIYLSCRDTGSGCKPFKWYYFSPTASCSTSKNDYNYLTILNYLDITIDHNDYICLWVEDRVGLHDTAISPQLHVDTGVYVVSGIPSEKQTQATQDLNNECRMYLDQNLIISCEFKSTIKIAQWAKDLNRVWPKKPELVKSPPKTIRVLLQSEIEAFYHENYFIKFESDQRTITSKGSEENYPITVVRRRVIPLLTTEGRLEVGTLTIKVRQR